MFNEDDKKKIMEKIQEEILHPFKEEVYVRHFRRYDVDTQSDRNPQGLLATGGCTIAALHENGSPDSGLVWGISRCSASDVFVRRLGYVKAVGMAKSKKGLHTKNLDRRHINGLAESINAILINREVIKQPKKITQETVDKIVAFITRPTPIPLEDDPIG